MTPNYTQIVADARRDYSPNYFTVGVSFEHNGSVNFRIAMSMQSKDEMVHMHDVKGIPLQDAIEEAYRRCEFDNGRAPRLVLGIVDDSVIKKVLEEAGTTLAVPTDTGN